MLNIWILFKVSKMKNMTFGVFIFPPRSNLFQELVKLGMSGPEINILFA